MPRNARPAATCLLVAAAALFAGSCGDDHAGHDHAGHEHDHDHGGESGDHAHVHKAPHGGTLVPLGEEFAHVEFVLDAVTGMLTGYVVDGCAENPVRLAQTSLDVRIGKDAAAFDVALASKANELTGEKSGDSSQFEGMAAGLKGLQRFEGTLKSVTVKGQTFQDVAFRYPEGNE